MSFNEKHNINIPKNDRKIIRKIIIFRIEILPKEDPLELKSPPPLKRIEKPGGGEEGAKFASRKFLGNKVISGAF